MTNRSIRPIYLVGFITLPFFSFAQSSSTGESNFFLIGIIVTVALLFMAAIWRIADSILQVERQSLSTGDAERGQPHHASVLSTDTQLGGGKVIRLKKGYNLNIKGKAEKKLEQAKAKTYALQPPNFTGMSPIPKVMVELGDEVKAGDPILFDKKRPDIMYCAPVSGEIAEIRRGAKRSIKEVVILADKGELNYKTFEVPNLDTASREELVRFMMGSGLWTLINERPYDVVPNENIIPRNIFISTFDTAPLAPDNNFVVDGQEAHFQKGLDVLNKLTSGKVHLGLNAAETPHSAFAQAKGVAIHYFKGAHPVGNVGVQIHHIDPINTTDKVWTLTVQEVIQVGKMFNEGRYDASRIVALVGSELKEPKYVKTYQGACVGDLVQGNIKAADDRIISGDVLSGEQKSSAEFLNFRDDQVTVIKEGKYFEMFGWLLAFKPRPTVSRTFPYALFNMEYEADTNTHGEKRAFVMTGQYEKVLPMDIYPQHLLKAILVNDFERMEGLGICELTEEDLALCEFVCTSKQPVQAILRQGLEVMRAQS